ncbi:LamG domain-containing protein [Streptomyces cucumeris]|uniref:LamG domain-containing protein n=1 Tax=Streptomyces cucumeris TaxID=2962890 RepID=UPI0020C84161|nr:LamG domain-containing protein [Streptomyces sp. NEAU-Y11]MCP9209278.1 LamG domain-containing protein [Streptomyces sp. NEAU-Y11]
MIRIAVEAAFGYAPTAAAVTWTDITGWVNLGEGVKIDRGASDELSETQPATATLVLDNSDGRFTSGNAASPYYPNVRRNCPIRVQVVSTAKNLVRHPSFQDETGDQDSGGWDYGSPGPLSSFNDDTRSHSGTWSRLVNWDDSGTGGLYGQTLYGLNIGVTHTASAWVWVAAGDPPVRLVIDGTTAGAPSTTTGAWQQITVTWTTTAAVHRLDVTTSLTSPAAGDQAWVDDVQVEEGAVPTGLDGDGARLHPRFRGMVNQWPISWNGLLSKVTITATDLFKWLARLPQLQPLLVEEVLRLGPSAYYPMSEPADSTTAGDISGLGAGSMRQIQGGTGGTVTFGETAGPPATGQSAAQLTPVSATSGRYLRGDLGPQTEASGTPLFLEAWFNTTTRGRLICAAASSDGQYQLHFLLDGSTGALGIEYTSSGLPRTAVSVATGALDDGAWHHLLYDQGAGRVYLDGSTSGYTVFVDSMLQLRTLWVGGYGANRIWSGALAHVAVHLPLDPFALTDYLDHYAAGAAGFAGEDAGGRVERLAGYAGISSVTVSGTFDEMASQGEGGKSALEMMREVEATESGRLLSDRDAAALVFQGRDLRYNPAPAVTLAYADLETDGVEFADDDQKLVNYATGSRPGGATQTITGPASIAAFGRYEQNVTVLKNDDDRVLSALRWMVHRYANPLPELRQIAVQAYSLPLATYRALLDADVSTALTITGLPAEAPTSETTAFFEGYSETLSLAGHQLDIHTSAADTDTVWILGDPTYSALGLTTRLAY